MTISLHDISIAPYLQQLDAVSGFLDKAKQHFESEGEDLQAIVESRLHADMLPLAFQIVSVAHHSAGAIEALKTGEFGPPSGLPELDYAGLQHMVAEARTRLDGQDKDELDACLGKDVAFVMGDRRLPFVAEHFILSFSLPNFFFHASTACDILRMKGAPLGKLDFVGTPRLNLG